MKWETIIGLEVHTQLSTKSKIFSGASTQFGAEPNTQTCAIDLGLPGVLPVLNGEVVRLAVLFGLSIRAEIPEYSIFARKNYFYPDLPKGYQISQYDLPIVKKGSLIIQFEDGTEKEIGITRAHLEEDAGKSLHEDFKGASGIDFNRAGTPLLEIVSEPDMHSAKEAVAYLKALHALIRYLGISDANMQEGSFRCDANISVRPRGQKQLGVRTEIKNINSFRFVERAIEYEQARHIDILENGGSIIQETRKYDADKDMTFSLRSKEEAHDYRYFPDPDLLPVHISPQYVEEVLKVLPELPWEKRLRFKTHYQLNNYDVALLTTDMETAKYFEKTLQAAGNILPKMVANWINGEVIAALNRENISIAQCPISAEQLGALLQRIHDKTISNNIGKQVFEAMWKGEGSADEIIAKSGLKQITDNSVLEKIIEQIIQDNPQQVEQYRSGKDKLFGYFVGQVMKATQGKANPEQVNELLRKKL